MRGISSRDVSFFAEPSAALTESGAVGAETSVEALLNEEAPAVGHGAAGGGETSPPAPEHAAKKVETMGATTYEMRRMAGAECRLQSGVSTVLSSLAQTRAFFETTFFAAFFVVPMDQVETLPRGRAVAYKTPPVHVESAFAARAASDFVFRPAGEVLRNRPHGHCAPRQLPHVF